MGAVLALRRSRLDVRRAVRVSAEHQTLGKESYEFNRTPEQQPDHVSAGVFRHPGDFGAADTDRLSAYRCISHLYPHAASRHRSGRTCGYLLHAYALREADTRAVSASRSTVCFGDDEHVLVRQLPAFEHAALCTLKPEEAIMMSCPRC